MTLSPFSDRRYNLFLLSDSLGTTKRLPFDTEYFKNHTEKYVQNAMKSGGLFTFGTNWWEPFFTEEESRVRGGTTIADYVGLSQDDQTCMM